MTALHHRRRDRTRAGDLRTKRAAVRAWARHGSFGVIAVAAVASVALRLSLGAWSVLDIVVLGVVLVMVGFVEWAIHLYLLHAPAESWRMRVLRSGTGHREHHLDPEHVGWLLLGTTDAALFVVLIVLGSIGWAAPLAAVVGSDSTIGPATSAATLALIALAHYEWTHLLVHTRYRPNTRLYRRLARNHRLHHYRNERYWLGVTSNLGDRVLGTLPNDKGDVPLSETARSLA